MRDGDSINFTKASCTLDGCVKIYTSRIESVDSETKKLMSGLFGKDGKEDELDESGNTANVNTKQARKKRQTNTIEADEEALNVKAFDVEFKVDPLFKKTAADFDEGGAKGLLLNHLCISNDGNVIFDASDSRETVLLPKDEENDLMDPSFLGNSLLIKIDLLQKWIQYGVSISARPFHRLHSMIQKILWNMMPLLIILLL